MRLAIYIFVCFAASTAINSTQTNYSGARDEVDKPISNADFLPNNFSQTRQLRQGKADQPDWCCQLKDQVTMVVLLSCKDLSPPTARDYVLRIGPDVTEEEWKKFIGNVIKIDTDVEIIDSSLTEVVMTVELLGQYWSDRTIISNNPKLKSIVIKGKEGTKLDIRTKKLEIKGNPALKSIKIEGSDYGGNSLTISDNSELETIELNIQEIYQLFAYGYNWTISNNPKLHRIQINCKQFWLVARIYIVGNKALTELNFPETVERFGFTEMYIHDNDNLETIKIPDTTYPAKPFQADKLEIRRNDKLKTIDLGKETRWKDTQLVYKDNPLASIIYATTTTTTTTTRAPPSRWNRERLRHPTGDSDALRNGLIALGVIALVLLLCCVGCCVFCCWRRSNRKKTKSEKEMKKKGKGKSKKKEEPPKKEDKSKAEESAKESPSGKASAPSDPI